MADDIDIDDLLDEVETKFVRGKSTDKKNAAVKSSRKKSDDYDIDKVLDDICGDTDQLEKCNIVRNVPSNLSTSRPKPSKCFPLCIGGSSLALGKSTSVNKRSCDTLRCTSCDFRVVSFNDFQWHKDTDYLFLRNNAPDFDRLKPKLKSKQATLFYSEAGEPEKKLDQSSMVTKLTCFLEQGLNPGRPGSRSYCCQCCHMTMDSLTEIRDLPVKWVCGNH
ncbi:cilia- and flagella-associated protein 418-like isoform X1 [Dreissena polymorpha]|uniref:cilia- and flagella-associated protein 418-like isoform X1 n=1 Tax=Dreissena polymorpha TaxID=45954 RepID=UPI0022640A0D|nr:cilia- and flagella-associated protein 418-like isoform X1 [Dreissena polymorpha]